MKVLAIPGSLREGSYNKKACLAAKELAPDDIEIEVFTLHEIPMFDADLEVKGVPAPVQKLKEEIKKADALLISTPEYNNMIPGVLKNTLEWLSRRDDQGNTVIEGKKVAIMGASTGSFGTVRSQNQLILLCTILKMQVNDSLKLPLAHADQLFQDGQLVDDKTRQRLTRFLKDFKDWLQDN